MRQDLKRCNQPQRNNPRISENPGFPDSIISSQYTADMSKKGAEQKLASSQKKQYPVYISYNEPEKTDRIKKLNGKKNSKP